MSRTRLLILAGALTLAAAACAPVHAIPVFARKYGYNCTMCHSGFPRLNDYGHRYRANGYQLPGREDDEKTVLEGPAPFAMRTSAGYNLHELKNTPGATDVNQFQLNSLDILSGGLLGRNIGYIFVYPPEIRGSRGVVAQNGTLEMASVIFSNIGRMSIRAGRFEPAYLAFSDKRRLSVAPYEIYDCAYPAGLAFSDTQDGVELALYPVNGLSFYGGWVNGSPNNSDNDGPADFYVRGVKVLGQGEGQTSGQRLGLSGYFGRTRPTPPLSGSRGSFTRWGPDLSLNFSRWNVDFQYLLGSASHDLVPAGAGTDFSGGFIQGLYLPRFDMAWFLRYGWVDVDDNSGIGDTSRWTVGGRYYPIENLAVHLEYSHRSENSVTAGTGDATENLFATRIDFAF